MASFLASISAFAKARFRDPIIAILVTIGTGLLLSLPYYAFGLKSVVAYIWNTVFGAAASIYVQPMPLHDHVLFYLTGYYGTISLGQWLFAGGTIMFVATIIVLVEGNRTIVRRTLSNSSRFRTTYVAVTVPSFKGPHGYPFAALFMLIVAVTCVAIARRLPPAAAWAFCLGLISFSAWQWEWNFTRMHGLLDLNFADTRWQMLQQAFASIGDEADRKQFALTGHANYLNYSILAFEYLKKGRSPQLGSTRHSSANLIAIEQFSGQMSSSRSLRISLMSSPICQHRAHNFGQT